MIHIYDSNYRGECRQEWAEQIDCMGWLEFNHPDRWPLCFHVPNEVTIDKRKPGWAQHLAKRQKMGVKNGVSDIIDFGIVRGAFELKRLDRQQSTPVTKDQRAFLKATDDSGGFAAICYGFDQFKLAYADYLEFVRLSG